MKTIALGLLFILAFSFAAESRAETFEVLNPNSSVYQGGVLAVRIADDLRGKNIRLYVFEELYQFNDEGFVFVGVPVGHNPGRYILYLVADTSEDRPVHYDFYYTYAEVLEQRFGTPWYAGRAGRMNLAVQKQRNRETAIKDTAYSLANIKENYATGTYIKPLKEITEMDGFGTLRLYGSYNRKNKTIRIEKEVPHNGVDLRAKTPLPVMAINSGKVLLARNFPLRGTEGNLLVIDHGSGILSLYLHLSRFRVKVGDMVEKGQMIALTGATPRGAPPHLHFMIKVHGVNVDPLAFIETMNRIF